MKTTWNPEETKKVMNILCLQRYEHCIKLYQSVSAPNILIAQVHSTSSSEITALKEQNISTTIFPNGSTIELWMMKYKTNSAGGDPCQRPEKETEK